MRPGTRYLQRWFFIGVISQIIRPYCIGFWYNHSERGSECWAPILERPTCKFEIALSKGYNFICNYKNASTLCNQAAMNGRKRCRKLVVKAYFLSLRDLSNYRDPSLFSLKFSSSLTVKQNKHNHSNIHFTISRRK